MAALQVLHVGRTKSREARHPKAAQLLQRLKDNNLIYISPVGSNDDWYWIYAAAQAGLGSLSRPWSSMRPRSLSTKLASLPPQYEGIHSSVTAEKHS